MSLYNSACKSVSVRITGQACRAYLRVSFSTTCICFCAPVRTRPAGIVASPLTDRWDDPTEVCLWLSGPWGAPCLAFPPLYPCLPPRAAPQPACSYLSQRRTLTEKGTWLLAWGRGGAEEGAGGFWRLYSCRTSLRKGRELLRNVLCFWQAGSVFTSSDLAALALQTTYLLSHPWGGTFARVTSTDTLWTPPCKCWQ